MAKLISVLRSEFSTCKDDEKRVGELWQEVALLLRRRNTSRSDARPCAEVKELLVVAAEAAVSAKRWDVARDALRNYDLTPSDEEYGFRVSLVRASIEEERCRGLTGTALIQRLLLAASYATEFMCKENARESCGMLWRILSPLMVAGRARYARQPLSTGLEALESEKNDKLYVLRDLFLRALATACEDDGDMASAAKYATAAVEAAKHRVGQGNFSKRNEERLMRARLHAATTLAQQNKSVTDKIAPTEPERAVEAFALRRLRSTVASLSSEEKSKLEQVVAEIKAILQKSTHLETIADSGRLCMLIDTDESTAVAKLCHKRLSDADDKVSRRHTPTSRAKTALLRCMLAATELDSRDGIPSWAPQQPALYVSKLPRKEEGGLDELDRRLDQICIRGLEKASLDKVQAGRLSRRVEALKSLERVLVSIARLRDPDLAQEAGVVAWNMGFCFTEPKLRQHAHKAFRLAARLLEDIKSPLVHVRVRLHAELAQCELDADFVARAISEVTAASLVDYGDIHHEGATQSIALTNDIEQLLLKNDGNSDETKQSACTEDDDDESRYSLRPFDPYIEQLSGRVDLRRDAAHDPKSVEEKASLILEHALEVPSAQLQWTMLKQVSTSLLEAEKLDGSTDELPQADQTILDAAGLFSHTLSSSDTENESFFSLGNPGAGAVLASLAVSPHSVPTPTATRKRAAQRVRLWCKLIDVVWRRHREENSSDAIQYARSGAAIVLRYAWSERTDAELCASQVTCQYALAETYRDEVRIVAEAALKDAQRRFANARRDVPVESQCNSNRSHDLILSLAQPPSEWTLMGVDSLSLEKTHGSPTDGTEEVEPPALLHQRQLTALKRMSVAATAAGIERATRLGCARLVRNGCVFLWNSLSHYCGGRFLDASLSELPDILERALAVAAEARVQDEWLCSGLSKILANLRESRGLKERAIQTCSDAIALHGATRPLSVKSLVEMRARLSNDEDQTAKTNDPPLFRAICVLEKLKRIVAEETSSKSVDETLCEGACAVGQEMRSQIDDLRARRERAKKLVGEGTMFSDVDVAQELMSRSSREADEELFEFRTEIWARLAAESARLGGSWTKYFASKCFEPLFGSKEDCGALEDFCYPLILSPDNVARREEQCSSDSDEHTLFVARCASGTVWRWVAIAETARARAVETEALNPNLGQLEKDDVRAKSLAHFARAMRFAANATDRSFLTYQAGKCLWNAVLPFSDTAVARRFAKVHVQCALSCLTSTAKETSWAGCGGPELIDLFGNFVTMLLDCVADEGDWDTGLTIIDDALASLGLLAKSVQDNSSDLGRMPVMIQSDQRGSEEQARPANDIIPPQTSTELSKSLRNTLIERRVSYLSKLKRWQHAAACLPSDGDGITIARAWATLARSSTDRLQQCSAYEKCLDAAKGHFERVEYLVEAAEWMLQNEAPPSDARSLLLLAVDNYFLRAGATSVRSDQTCSVCTDEKDPGRKQNNNVDPQQSKVATADMSHPKTSELSKESETSLSKSSHQRQQDDLSGLLESTRGDQPFLDFSAKEIELLIRSLSMLAQLSTTLCERRRNLLMGHHFAKLCVERHVAAANAAIMNSEEGGNVDIQDSQHSQKLGKGDEADAQPQNKQYAPLSSLNSWFAFVVDDKFVAWAQSAPHEHRRNVFHRCEQLPLTAHHLTLLSDALIDIGYHAHALAPLSMLQLLGVVDSRMSLTSGSAKAAPLVTLAGLRRARLLLALGVTSQAEQQLRQIGVAEESVENESADEAPKPIEKDAPEEIEVTRLLHQHAHSNDAKKKSGTEYCQMDWRESSLATRYVWTSIAAEFVALGKPVLAGEYLTAARRHNDAFGDARCAARVTEVAGWISMHNGVFGEARHLFQLAVKSHDDTLSQARLTLALTSALLAAREVTAARVHLERAIALYRGRDETIETVLARCRLEARLAQIEEDPKERLQAIVDALYTTSTEPPHPVELDARSGLFSSDDTCRFEAILDRSKTLWSAAGSLDSADQSVIYSLPVARRVGALCVSASRQRHDLSIRVHEVMCLKGAQVEEDLTDVVQKWLAETAPEDPNDERYLPQNVDHAILHATTAVQIVRLGVTSASPAACATVGRSLVLGEMCSGAADEDVWKSLENGDQAAPLLECLKDIAKAPDPLPAPRSTIDWLSNAIIDGLRHGRYDEVGDAALSMVEHFGSSNPLNSSHALLLYQSCVARRWLLRHSLERIDSLPQTRPGVMIRDEYLSEMSSSSAWKCNGENESIVHQQLCCSHIEVNKEDLFRLDSVPGGLSGGVLASAAAASLPVVADPRKHARLVPTARTRLAEISKVLNLGRIPSVNDILTKTCKTDTFVVALQMVAVDTMYATVAANKAGITAAISKHTLSAAETEELKSIERELRNWKSELAEGTRDDDNEVNSETVSDKHKKIDESWSMLVERMSAFFSPVLGDVRVASALSRIREELDANSSSGNKKVATKPAVYFLADVRFLRWPLEALIGLRGLQATRDFSIHTVCARMMEDKGGTGSAYMFDPRKEEVGTESEVPESLARCGSRQIVDLTSVKESTFIYFGPGLAQATPASATAPPSTIRLATIIDRVDTTLSKKNRQRRERRFAALDRRIFESDFLETVAAWTVFGGVGAISINQWQSNRKVNELFLSTTLTALNDDKLTISEAVQTFKRSAEEKIERGEISSTHHGSNCVLFGLPSQTMI